LSHPIVTRDDILDAAHPARIVAEPSACVPIGALRSGIVAPAAGDEVVALISGANTAVTFN
jgi:threonine dehydratase